MIIILSVNQNDNEIREPDFDGTRALKKYIIRSVIIIAVIAVVTLSALFISGVFNVRDYYNYSIDGSSVIDMQTTGNKLVVLTQTKTIYLNNKGRSDTGSTFSYSNPVLSVNGGNVLVYDRGGTGYRVEKNKKTYLFGDAEANIVTAAIGKNKTVAYAVNAEKDSFSQSSIFIRNGKGNKSERVFTSKQDYCVGLAVSDNDDYIAVALLGVSNAEYYIEINIVETSTGSVIGTSRFNDENLIGLDFISNNSLSVYTDKAVYHLSISADIQNKNTVKDTELISVSIRQDGLSSVLTSKDGNIYEPIIDVYQKNGELAFNLNYKNDVDIVSTSAKYLGVVSNNIATIYNRDGFVRVKISATENYRDIAVSSDRAYLLLADGIFTVPLMHSEDDPVVNLGNSVIDDAIIETIGEETEETSVSSETTAAVENSIEADAADASNNTEEGDDTPVADD